MTDNDSVDSDLPPKYHVDFYSWSLDQAARLRQLQRSVGADTQGIDFENLIDEVEDLAAGVRRILRDHIQQVIIYMGAIAYTQPEKVAPHLNSWLLDIDVFRSKIVAELVENPGLKDQLEDMCTYQWRASTPAIDLKVHKTEEDYTQPTTDELRERIDQETPPTVDEVLGFDRKLLDSKSTKVLNHYLDADPDAPRYPVCVRDALKRIRKQGHTR